MTFINNLSKVVRKLILLEFCYFLLIFPLENFRINLDTVIFPSLEICLLYYFATFYRIDFWLIFLIGIIFDQLYSMPIGTNSLVLIAVHLLLRVVAKFLVLRNYLTNFLIFAVYYFLVVHFRYLLILSKGLSSQGYFTVIAQYLTTIFSYNLLRIPLDQGLQHAKIFKKKSFD